MLQGSFDTKFIVHTYRGKHLLVKDKDKEIYNLSSCYRYIYDLV